MIPPELLALVPGCEQGQPPLLVDALPGGFGRNEVLRIDTLQGRFVWRRRLGALDRPGAHATAELAAHRRAAAAGLAPGVVVAAADGGWILMEFVDAAPWTEAALDDDTAIEQLGRRLAILHSLPVPAGVVAADAPAMADGYLAVTRTRDQAVASAQQSLANEIRQITDDLAADTQRSVLVHGDLMASNLLGPLPVLVDWEYAQLAEPAWDLACLLSYYPFLEARQDRLLGSAGLDDAHTRARVKLQCRRFLLLNRLWELAYPSPG
ncbi:MAG TPA: aminoglycoside phosphotransferase family protein [Steroidobacteraceae bacterium]|nr:aminoglycoside phosphotransferase family protein [Steroidobacteraceae bacterium]